MAASEDREREATHTPGPWSVEDPLGPEIISVVARAEAHVWEWQHIAQLSTEQYRDGDPGPDEQAANARLIAAAPDLLAAARKALNYIENTENSFGITLDSGDALRAALARAAAEVQS